MELLNGRKIVLVKKQLSPFPVYSNDIEKYVKGRSAHIEIKPARFENIEIYLFFPTDNVPPNVISIWYFDTRFAKRINQIYTLELVNKDVSNDGKQKRIKLTNYCSERPSNEVSLYPNICIESIDADDFEFQVEVHLKYTYQVHGGTFETEFSFEDGECSHTEGDTLTYDKDTELSVMEINHELGIVYCSAIGFPR